MTDVVFVRPGVYYWDVDQVQRGGDVDMDAEVRVRSVWRDA